MLPVAIRRLGGSLQLICEIEMETAVWEKIARYQKYLEKCMNSDAVNEKHVSDPTMSANNNTLLIIGLIDKSNYGSGLGC